MRWLLHSPHSLDCPWIYNAKRLLESGFAPCAQTPCVGHVAGEADRLQRLEVELLGASSTGYDPTAAAAAIAAARAQDGGSSSGAAPSAPFGLPLHADFQWAWR